MRKKTTFSEFQFEIFEHTFLPLNCLLRLNFGNEMRNLPEPQSNVYLRGRLSSDTYPVPATGRLWKSWAGGLKQGGAEGGGGRG